MNSERERQVTSIFHSAIEREPSERAAFLDGACAGDIELRNEVDALIDSHEGAGSFIDAPAYERSAELLRDEHQAGLSGRTLGHYRLVRLLGTGGMGEVYLAEDMQLGRSLAVKVLSRHLTEDSAIVARFRQEARAASALNHPNIVTIYEVGESDGTHFIATELVEGVTLRQLLTRTTLEVRKAIDIAAQVASALSKAHGAGVVHRDIKPENVMVDAEGHAKVLDFGIAKLMEQARGPASQGTDVPTRLKVETGPGAVMGTAHYMSPEQARGLRDVDARTDIFSLGVVLYEMLAGRQPFEGDTPTDVTSSILNREPPPLARYNREVSEALELVVQKALEKNRDERYQTAKDLLSDLRRVRQRFDSGNAARADDREDANAAETRATSLMGPAAPGTNGARPDETAPIHNTSSAEYIVTELKRHKRGIVIALVTLVLVGASVAFALYKYAGREKPAASPVFQNVQQTRITTSGRAGECNISPDGRYVVYKEMADDGNESLWVRQTETGNTLEIVPPRKGSIGGTSFSPNGNFVYYVFFDMTSDVGSLYQVSSIRGTPKKVLADIDSPVGISPDGSRAVFVRSEVREFRTDLIVANLDGTGERVIATRGGGEWFSGYGPAWSPDGKTIVCGAGTDTGGGGGDSYSLVEVDVASGAVKELGPKRWRNIGRAVWMPDGRAILLLALEGHDWQLWRVSLPDGEAGPITNFLSGSGQSSLGVTADGRKVVTVALDTVSQVWSMPASGDTSRAKQITSGAGQDGHQGLGWTPEGRLVFSSRDGGQSDIWIMDADGSNRRRLTSDANRDYSPAVSPDGRYVVFETSRPKANTLWRMDLDGSNLTQLTRVEAQDPQFSPDGRWVVYSSWAAPPLSLQKVSIDGGEPVRLTDYLSTDPAFSPDGNWIAFHYLDDAVTKLWRNAVIPAAGGARPVKLFDRPNFRYQHVQWTPDGRSLSYIGPPAVPSNIWLQPVEGSEPRKLTDFKSGAIYRHTWSRDGKWLVLARGAETTDVVLLTDIR